MSKINIVLLSGNIGAGKDTAAQILQEHKHYQHYKFADKLKDHVALLIGIYKEDLSHRNKDYFVDRYVKENVPVWNGMTPRELLQKVGTECFRKGLFEDIWPLLCKQEIEKNYSVFLTSKVVVSDCRFPNEHRIFLKDPNYNTTLVYIERAEIDDQMRPLVLANMLHESEKYHTYLKDNASVIIKNNGTLEEFKKQILAIC